MHRFPKRNSSPGSDEIAEQRLEGTRDERSRSNRQSLVQCPSARPFDEISMTFTAWQALSSEERGAARKTWNAYADGYWHALNAEAVEHFKREYGTRPEIRKVVGGTFHGGHLIIGVCKNTPAGNILPLPDDYYGFRVVQLDS